MTSIRRILSSQFLKSACVLRNEKSSLKLHKSTSSPVKNIQSVPINRLFSTQTPTQLIRCDLENNVKNIILSHSKTRNSLSYDMMSTLVDAITENEKDPNLRVIVISSEGPVFSAGHNLKELTATTGIEYHKKIFSKATELMDSIMKCPVPVIAKVNGLAAAAGCQLVATCDIVVCSNHSTFSTPGANFGIFCSTPGIAVGRCVPKSTAMHMLLTGIPMNSVEAYNSGLVTRVVQEDQLDSEVNKICEAIKAKSRSVVTLGKQFYYKQISRSIQEAYKLGEDIMVENINMIDGQEGIDSFAQKRKPKWEHN